MSIEDIISSSVASAQEAGTLPPDVSSDDSGGSDDAGSSDAGGDPVVEAAAEPAATSSAEAAPVAGAPPVVAPVAEPDEIDKMLAEEGFKAPIAGKPVNRIPHTRVKEMVAKVDKKWQTKYDTDLQTERTKSAAKDERLTYMDRVENLINTDADRYMALLAEHNPAFKKFTQPAPAATPVVAAVTEPMPKPDHKFEDGTLGYSEGQHQKLMDWNQKTAVAAAVAQVRKEYEDRLGPIEKDYRTGQIINQNLATVRANVAAVKQAWGAELVDKHEAEIGKVLRENPALSLEAAAAQVLLPKVRGDRETMRTSILEEINGRVASAAAAAATSAPAAVNPGRVGGERSIEQIIKDSIRGANLK